MPPNPEQLARENLDQMLCASCWAVQNDNAFNGVARSNIGSSELKKVVTANLQRTTRLRKSILQNAFTGGFM